MAALIASVLSQLVVDLVLTYSDVQDIWDKLISVYEQSSNQRRQSAHGNRQVDDGHICHGLACCPKGASIS
jgi:hypothetical protein